MNVVPGPEFALTEAERSHPLWLKLEAHLKARLASKLDALCRPVSEQETARIRGHIEFLKAVIRLGNEPLVID